MNDRETYAQWVAAYENIDTRRIIGYISADEADRLVRNMEERLGVDRWSLERWRNAHNSWLTKAGYLDREGA